MILEIETFNTNSGWSSPGNVSVHGLNEHKEYISGYYDNSLMFYFSSNGLNDYIEKTFGSPIDVSGYDEIVVSLFSTRQNSDSFRKFSDFKYVIDFGTSKQFYAATWGSFTDITLDISSISTIERIRIICLHNDGDYLVCSNMVAVKDEVPLDLYQSLKTGLEYYRDNLFTESGRQIGNLTGTIGDSQITVTNDTSWLESYVVVKIKEGANSEIHQLISGSGATFQLGDLYDGPSLINTYTNADVYIYFPIELNQNDKEIIYPGISVKGFIPQPIQRYSLKDKFVESYDGNNYKVKNKGMLEEWRIQIDVESRDYELIANMTKIVRRLLSKNVLWINGRKHDILWDEIASEVNPIESVDFVPKMVYLITISIIEDIEEIENPVASSEATIGYTITEQGEIP